MTDAAPTRDPRLYGEDPSLEEQRRQAVQILARAMARLLKAKHAELEARKREGGQSITVSDEAL